MKRKKILFVSYFYPPVAGQGLPGTQRSLKFIRNIQKLDKYVLTIEPSAYPDYFTQDHPVSVPVTAELILRTEVFDLFQYLVSLKNKLKFGSKALSNHSKIEEDSAADNKDCGAHSHPQSFFQKFKDIVSGILTYPDEANCWIPFAVKAGRKIVREESIDFVFATGKPWSALIAAYFIKGKRTQLIVDFRDPWVNNPFEEDLSPLRKRIDKFFETRVVRKADWVFLNTEYLRLEFLKRYSKEPQEKFITVTNGFDSSDFGSDALTSQQETLDKDRLVITHAGLLYGLRDPIAIFKALEQYYQNNVVKELGHILFRQVGGVTLDYNFQDYTQSRDDKQSFDNVGQVPYRECLEHLSKSDILVIIQPDTKTQIPSKLFEYIYLEKSILTIAPLDGALAMMVKKYDLGDIFDPDDVDGIAQYLVRKVKEKKCKGSLHCDYEHKDEFDIKNITAKFEDLLINEPM